MEEREPGRISGFLGKFHSFLPTDRKVRVVIQSFIENRMELAEVLPKDSIRCSGKIIYLRVNPYLKKEILTHSDEILSLLRDREHLYFDVIR